MSEKRNPIIIEEKKVGYWVTNSIGGKIHFVICLYIYTHNNLIDNDVIILSANQEELEKLLGSNLIEIKKTILGEISERIEKNLGV